MITCIICGEISSERLSTRRSCRRWPWRRGSPRCDARSTARSGLSCWLQRQSVRRESTSTGGATASSTGTSRPILSTSSNGRVGWIDMAATRSGRISRPLTRLTSSRTPDRIPGSAPTNLPATARTSSGTTARIGCTRGQPVLGAVCAVPDQFGLGCLPAGEAGRGALPADARSAAAGRHDRAAETAWGSG